MFIDKYKVLYWKNKIEKNINPIPKCYGEEFEKYRRFLNQSQWWSLKKLERYQFEQLKKIIKHCYNNVPYYRKTWDRLGIKPNIEKLSDIKKFPFVTKDDVLNDLDSFVAINISKSRMEYATTGGTSGKQLGLYIEKKTNNIRMAFEWRNWNWHDYHFNDKVAVLRGAVLRDIYQYGPEKNNLYLSVYDLTDKNIKKYIELLNSFKPKVIRGYPSALSIVAKYIKSNNIKFNKESFLKSISTTSETLYDWQRKIIEKYFNAKIYDKYGNSEQVTMIGQCEHGNYHEFMEYGLTEIINEEIVGTEFTNYAMPLIRYKTGDKALLYKGKCKCGRNLKCFKKIVGRLQEMCLTKNNNLISMTAINMHSDVFDNVKQFQFYQEKQGKLDINIIPNINFSKRDREYILRELKAKFGNQMDIKVKLVDRIPLTRSGKHRFLIQKLNINK